MSTASQSSWKPDHRLRHSSRNISKSTRASRAHHNLVNHEEARSFALRTAFLHYLLQPKAKRKQYIAAPPKTAAKSHQSVGQLIQEYGSGSSSSLKLPHNFATPLLGRVGGVLRGNERLPGYNDAAVKRSFAEAYTALSEKNFRKTIDKERNFEPLVLIFYSQATKAAKAGRAYDDDSWKGLPDRHLALFIRLALSVFKDYGHDKDRPELTARLKTLEDKLLRNDQNLVGNDADGTGKTIEVTIPLSYDVKDMPLVQVVASIFGLSLSDVQAEINDHRSTWTEEAALKDLKSYQLRLNSDMPGALCSHDFDLDEAFDEWKKAEAPHLSQMMLDLLTAKPALAKTSTTAPTDRTPSSRPQSMFIDEQAFADLNRAMSPVEGSNEFDPTAALNSLTLGEASSIRTVANDETLYTFIPSNPRAFFKYILQHAMSFDQLHADPEVDYQPLSKQSMDLMTELCVRWRIPQSSRLICILEIAAKKFTDREIVAEELDTTFDFIKTPLPEVQKPPHIHMYSAPLTEIEPSRWTIHDLAAYQHTLYSLHDSLLRELYDLLEKCYDTKAPNIGAVMFILDSHINQDPNFSPRPEAAAEFSEHLAHGLRAKAKDVYRQYMEKEIPSDHQQWDFAHVVKLGKAVAKVCDRIRKRYKSMPEIMGVNPLAILVEEIFPSFEGDAAAIIRAIMQGIESQGLELSMEDGFELYKELVAIRTIHRESLPLDHPFGFDIEELLVGFVWRLISNAEGKMVDFVDQAIKQDQFQVRTDSPDRMPMDSERHSVSIIDIFMLFNQTTDTVFKLDWENDEHHARFMTVLARSFATGIGRYCETVEQRFAREMDRPSAEEIAAQNKSTQERWMQYAKDAWNNREKAEPFQFYAEVCDSTQGYPSLAV